MPKIIGLGAVIIGGAAVVTLAGTALAHSTAQPNVLKATVQGTANTPQGTLPHAFLKLATWPDSLGTDMHGANGGAHPDWVTYTPSTTLQVPQHALVTVTITQYDGGELINNDFFAHVHGTVGGAAVEDGKAFTSIPADEVGHTFTLHMFPMAQQESLFVSVPLHADPDDAPTNPDTGYPTNPHVITFSFITGGPGRYVFQCEFPCGDGYYAKFGGPMSTQSYMEGTVTVV